MDLNQPRITWSIVGTAITLAFSSGTGWISIFDNKETDVKQWERINDLEAKTERHDAQLQMYATLSKSIDDLSTATNGLVTSTEVASNQAKTDAIQREKADRLLGRMGDDISDLKIKMGRIEEKLK